MGWYPHNNNQTPCLARLSTIRRPKFSRKPLSLLALKKAALVATTIVLVKDLYDTVDALRQAGLLYEFPNPLIPMRERGGRYGRIRGQAGLLRVGHPHGFIHQDRTVPRTADS